jgi:GTPase
LYDPRLTARRFAVVANKMDLPEAAANLRRFNMKFRKISAVPVSAVSGDGIEKVKKLLEDALRSDLLGPLD